MRRKHFSFNHNYFKQLIFSKKEKNKTMFVIIIMIFSCLCCFEMFESSQNYQVHDGVNINTNVDPSLIINSMRINSKFVCLKVCNSNKDCLSTVYIESEENDNCILYKKNFNTTETTTSSNSKLFTKKSNNNNNNRYLTI
jgi:hypothetical protein